MLFVFAFISIKIPHFVIRNLQSIQYYKLQILLVCLFLKMAEILLESNETSFIYIQVMQFFISFVMKIMFLFYLFKNYMILTIRPKKFFEKIERIPLFSKYYESNIEFLLIYFLIHSYFRKLF